MSVPAVMVFGLCMIIVAHIVPKVVASFEIGVGKDDCFSIITKDGIIDECVTSDQQMKADPNILALYKEILIVVYKASGRVIASSLLTPERYPSAFNAQNIIDKSNSAVQHIWPGNDEVVETYSFDMHFYDALKRPVGELCVYVNPGVHSYCTHDDTGRNVIRVGALKPGVYTAYYHVKGDLDPADHPVHTTRFVIKGSRDSTPGSGTIRNARVALHRGLD